MTTIDPLYKYKHQVISRKGILLWKILLWK